MKSLFTTLTVFFATFLNIFSFSGEGSGTKEDPYQITDVNQLQEMKDDLEAHYILMNDIDAAVTKTWNVGDHDDNPETPDSAMGWEPVGSNIDDYMPFRGQFDGQNYVIDSLYINRPGQNYIGLFGLIRDTSVIQWVGLENVNIKGDFYVGGLVGWFYESYILNSYSKGMVSGRSKVGGLAGYIVTGIVGMCFSEGIVEGSSTVGGLIGQNRADTLLNSYSLCTVTGDSVAGGLIGDNGAYGVDILHLFYSYSAGKVNCEKSSGGFIGNNTSKVDKCIRSCFWDKETSLKSDNPSHPGVQGKTTSEMTTKSTFTDAGWNFDYTWDIGPDINDGYPFFRDNPAVSVKEKSDKIMKLTASPNPATENINIILPIETEISFIRISDISGREVKNVSINSYTDKISMNISDLPQGFYIVNLYLDEEVFSCPMIVE